MNILSINPYKIAPNINKQNKTNRQTPMFGMELNKTSFGLKLNNPITEDTVTFSQPQAIEQPSNAISFGMTLTHGKFLKSRVGGVSNATAMKIHKVASEIQPEIETFIRGLFADYMVTAEKPNNLIAYIAGRAKKPGSIAEKSKVIEENTIAGVFKNMTDLNAVKIVMQKGDRTNSQKVLDILADAIKRGLIILEEIEAKRPGAAKKLKGKDAEKWDYIEPDNLQQFVNIAEKAKGKPVNYLPPDLTPANYTALHFLFRLPGQKRVFELQLMGLNVARFKDLDDILYKVLNNKNVDKKFKPIVDTLKPIVMTQDDKNLLKYIKIREKIDKLKFTEQEFYLLISRLIQEEQITNKLDTPEYVEKASALLRMKDFDKSDLSVLIDNSEFEIDYQNKELVKNFKNKVDAHEKFKAYRAQAFLFQREKKTSALLDKHEYFLPLSEDLPEDFDLNKLYKRYLQALAN